MNTFPLVTCETCHSQFYFDCDFYGLNLGPGSRYYSRNCASCYYPIGSRDYDEWLEWMIQDLNDPEGACQRCPSRIKCLTVTVA